MEVYFATSNKGKLNEAVKILGSVGVEVKQYDFDYTEIRSDILEEVAKDSVIAAYKLCKKPVFVEDAGLFIDGLNGFPGTYSGWVFKKLGNDGILRLMAGVSDRSARFESCIAYTSDGSEVKTFNGVCEGMLSKELVGNAGFGYDPLFIPQGASTTFAQSIALKNKLSHRYNSLLQFSNNLRKHR